ncbi:MAG TPA: hypothetical protein PLW66_05980, partial [Saprospiraceae bacterium]|nr:hypothetical protein [Saprospiraceae bacterium]
TLSIDDLATLSKETSMPSKLTRPTLFHPAFVPHQHKYFRPEELDALASQDGFDQEKDIAEWEALIAADPGGIVSYRLPDLPDAVAALSFSLRTYNFGNSVETRAESYANLSDPARIMQYYLAGNDPRWQTKGKYVARIRNF